MKRKKNHFSPDEGKNAKHVVNSKFIEFTSTPKVPASDEYQHFRAKESGRKEANGGFRPAENQSHKWDHNINSTNTAASIQRKWIRCACPSNGLRVEGPFSSVYPRNEKNIPMFFRLFVSMRIYLFICSRLSTHSSIKRTRKTRRMQKGDNHVNFINHLPKKSQCQEWNGRVVAWKDRFEKNIREIISPHTGSVVVTLRLFEWQLTMLFTLSIFHARCFCLRPKRWVICSALAFAAKLILITGK